MSAAGTPSTDPWVILARERSRYEEQFKSLKPTNGIVTGDQAKGFFLQSQLPPLVLGQIWSLADTDSDGKMDIHEFSIACKLINLKLRGFDIPKGLPPSLLASLQVNAPPAIPPLPNSSLIGAAPPRPHQPPKVVPLLNQQQPQSIMQPPSASLNTVVNAPPTVPSMIPPVIPPVGGMMPAIPPVQPALIGGAVPQMSSGFVPGVPATHIPLATAATPPLIPGITPAAATVVAQVSPTVAVASPLAAGPGATSTPRASVTSLDRTASVESPLVDWAVPHQTKLKYTQIFNTTDRTRSGYLSGAQARNVMVQSKLPQNILAQIWNLSDMDADGRLGCEEFVLALHLCEQAALGNMPPAKLPPDLIPPSFRRTARTASISSQGSGPPAPPDQDPASTLLQTSFEDKRKENFEKGQAELERRRKALLDQQKKETEERIRKEKEEIERREKARLEAERKRMEELEKQIKEQQEQERLKEEERKRQAEQREAARKEMERQRQLEWEKQRLQELQNQRQREQENVLKLKAKNQSLTIELSSLNEQVRELSQKICDTRVGVSNVKTTIDGMRTTRDTQMQEMSQLKNKLKEQNAKLLTLSQEKAKLEAKNKLNAATDEEQARIAFENKEVTIKNLREKIADMQNQIDGKLTDIENNNTQLSDLKTQMTNLIGECEKLYSTYEDKKTKVMEIKNANKAVDYNASWPTNDAWGNDTVPESAAATTTDWPVDNWASQPQTTSTLPPGTFVQYKALYEFAARNNDEISFQPDDIVNVPFEQTGEPGWLVGEIGGHTGWFPESYVEPVDGVGVRGDNSAQSNATVYQEEPSDTKRLEGIAEVPEVTETVVANDFKPAENTTQQPTVNAEDVEYFISNYPYQSQEQGDLTFNAGEMIAVIKKEGDWWTGKIGNVVGIFPSNYVQKVDVNSSNATGQPNEGAVSAAAVTSALESATCSADNEVSQINEETIKAVDKPLDASITANAQVVKSKKPEIAQVIAPYQATSSEQLSLARGQLIMIRKKTDSGWWEGELQAKGRKRQVGWFPASYVKVLNSSGRASGRTTPVSTTRMQQEIVIDKVVALFPYTAGNPDELSFAKDDIISVTAREEEAWWRGELNGVSGLFPSNYVAPLQQSVSLEEKRRRERIKEFIETEKAYVHDMSIVHEIFEIPLRNSGIVKTEHVDEIFYNWREILECNQKFLSDLMDRNIHDTIGSIICKHLPKMTAYITFCGKQLDSAALLQRLTETSATFKQFVKKCQSNTKTKGMPLSSFLIKPMQRITKYPLLITKIMSHTPDNHPDRKYLEQSLVMAEQFLNSVNENVRIKENEERLNWLQQHVHNDLNICFNSGTNKLGARQILHYGILTKLKSGKELIGFLFNDFVLLVQASKTLGSQFTFQRNSNVVYKMYKQPILIGNLEVSRESSEMVEQGTDSNRVIKLQDTKTKYKISLLTSSVHDCNLWIKSIDNAKETLAKLNVRKRPKTQVVPSGLTCGRLLVHVQKGKRFISSGNNNGLVTESVFCKVSLGNQVQQTDVATKAAPMNGSNGGAQNIAQQQNAILVWNYSMQFQLRNINEETLMFAVYEYNPYRPDEFLGRADLKVSDVYRETQHTNGPVTKKLILHQVESGEIVVKLDLQMFNSY